MNFSNRCEEKELMDDVDIDQGVLNSVLKDVGRANLLLGGNKITLSALKSLVQKNPQSSYTVLDVGCGNGEMLRAIALFFRTHDLRVRLRGWDISNQAIALAKLDSEAFPEIEFEEVDITMRTNTDRQFDFVISTLTLHHFTDTELPLVLENMQKISRIAIVINDLQRSKVAYMLFKVFSVIFIRTSIAKSDGLMSIRRGFRRRELEELSHKIPGLHSIKWQWAFRYVWIIAA